MKKIYLLLTILFLKIAAFAQTTEIEPNDDFATAMDIPYGDQTIGTLDATDTLDHYKMSLPFNANVYVYVEITNTGSTGLQHFYLDAYNGLTIGGEYVGNFFSTGYYLNPGETFYDTLRFCGKAPDDYFLKLKGDGDFEYKVEWIPVNAVYDEGYNNDLPYATPFSFNIEKQAGINYNFWGNDNWDPIDFFSSTLPVANYDSVYLKIRAQNSSCANNKWIKYYCYKNDLSTLIDSGYVGNKAAVNSYQDVFSTIPLAGMHAGDKLIVKFISQGAFYYRFKYSKLDEFEEDVEDNCCTDNAIDIVEGQVWSGNVGEYDQNNGVYIDEFDTYRIVLPHDGAVKLYVKGRNDQCDFWENDFYCQILDEYGNYLTDKTLLSWNNSSGPTCGEIELDTIKLRAMTAGTFYIQLGSSEKASYNLRYELVDSTAGEAGESYNNPVVNVIQVNPGETKKGHIRFVKNAYQYDGQDIYHAILPADASAIVYVKATYRGDYEGSNTGSSERLSMFSSGFTDRLPSNPPVAFYTPDAVYLDTFYVCGAGAGDIYFTWSAGLPYEYEFRFELTDSSSTEADAEPNNSFAQAVLAQGGQTKKGHINYVHNVTTDTYDYYKMVYVNSDSLVIPIQATNMSCEGGKVITVKGFNKNQVQLFSRNIANNTNVNAGQTIFDTIKRYVIAPDTIYFRVEATDAFKYQFSTNSRLPTSLFRLDGDSSVCLTTKIYTARNIGNEVVAYHWSLPDGGGILTSVDSVATVQWNASGNRSIQLYLSNAEGNSQTKKLKVFVNASAPTAVPVIANFARMLSTSSIPTGSGCQWYKNNVIISGAIDSSYYALLAGSYTVRFVNGCGQGPFSATVSFAADAQTQSINFPHTATISMAPNIKIVLPATANSGLPVYYQKITGTALLVNDSLSITGAGSIIIKASQPGDDNYTAAADKYDTITVVKGNQVITFDPVADQIFSSALVPLTAGSSMGQSISFSIVAGNAGISSNKVHMTGAGNVTVRASQAGNTNYNAATPVNRSFCIGVRTLTTISGEANPCLAAYTYTAQKIPGADFVWSLSGGGTLTTHNDTAFVVWQTPGTYTLKVKANSACDPVYSNELAYTVTTSSNTPAQVSNMLPVNNAVDQQLPLQLSWIPGNNTVNYDLYVWDATLAQPSVPYKSNINAIDYTLPINSFAYNKTYKWRVVAKNPCSQTAGPVQQFSLIPLPDLAVSEITVPAAANSGQTITINWKVKNIGPGNTTTSQSWYDAVFLSFDTVPDFVRPPELHGPSWSQTNIPIRPLLLGTKLNISALDSGMSYSNSINYTLPLSYSQPLYVYVITNYSNGGNKPLQVTKINDTARGPQTINVTLSPTPDLRVDTVLAPAITFSGSTINLAYKVKNYGVLTPVGAAWNDSVFISQSPLFDRNNAIPLKTPKAYGSYYPNAPAATVSNNTQVLPDSSYTRNMQVVVPNFIFGTWFIYVQANGNDKLYEGALNNNNINRAPLQVYLTPTPKLTINSLSVPVTDASTTQSVGVNWNIFNEGFTDNIEKNKGHYLYHMIGHCPCGGPLPPGSVCVGPPKYADSLAEGSSYWTDKVYLSTNPGGLDINNARMVSELKHGIENGGYLYPDYLEGNCSYAGAINVATAITPGKNFPSSTGFAIPEDMIPGDYYVYVYTNPGKTVFEYPGTAQIKRSTLTVSIKRPDIIVSTVAAPAAATGGQVLTINYSVLNNGPGAVFNHVRRDRIYVSSFPSFDASAQLIDTKTYTEDLPVGTAAFHSFNYTFAPTVSGARYFYVHTNYDSAFRETSMSNNLSAASNAVLVSTASPSDLYVSSFQLPDTIPSLFSRSVIYTVTNNGTGTASGTWVDSLYFSCSSAFNTISNYFAAKKTQSRILLPGSSYTDTINFSIPKMSFDVNNCFANAANTTAFFFLKANADNAVYEGSNTSNNITGSGSRIVYNPLVDHIIITVSAGDTTTAAMPYAVSWSIKNIGDNPSASGITSYYSQYRDAVYFSADSVLNSGDTYAGDFKKTDILNKGQVVNSNKTVTTPNIPTGDYYVFVKTNYDEEIKGELNSSNNAQPIRQASGEAKKIHVIRPLLPDLVDSILSAPSTIAIGQPMQLIRRVTNKGAGATYPASFANSITLSKDFVIDNNDRLLSSKTKAVSLLPGQYFDDTITVTINNLVTAGNYVLIGKANSNVNTNVYESNTANNFSYQLISVYDPPEADLIVDNILLPDTAYLGYTIDTAKWVVKNESENAAVGISADGIYLSGQDNFDATAQLIGIKNKKINMSALATDTVWLAPMVNSVTEGDYNVFVKTDILNNIVETDKDNNTGMAAKKIYVKVKELPMNVLETNTLYNTDRYYKLKVPDSLLGSTIKITLKTNDSVLVRNEMFVASSYVPSAAHFDYRFEVPNYGNQQVLITSVMDTVYYIAFNCVSPNPPVQNISIKAEKLPFAVLNVQTNSGGNIGNVTVKISGSLFRDSMQAKLSNAGTTIYATTVYFTNSTTVYATFNLQGRPLGIYDVTLIKTDHSEAVLPNGFSIVNANNGGLNPGGSPNSVPGNGNDPGCDPGSPNGLNSQLVVQIVAPPSVVTNWPFIIQINYNNPTNSDIPAQSRVLYIDAGLKLALTAAGVPNGTSSLYLELTEPGGPPGIIRAGGSGTITVYTRSPLNSEARLYPELLIKLQ